MAGDAARPTKRGRTRGVKQVELAERSARALDLRRQGYAYDEIAVMVGMSRTGATKLIGKALDRMIAEPAEHVRRLELKRLDRLYRAAEAGIEGIEHEGADGLPHREGAPQFIAQALAISARRAKLLGIDAPEKAKFELTAGLDVLPFDPTKLGAGRARELLRGLAEAATDDAAKARWTQQADALEGAE